MDKVKVTGTPGGYTVYGDFEGKVCCFCGRPSIGVYRSPSLREFKVDGPTLDMWAVVVCTKCMARCRSRRRWESLQQLVDYVDRLEKDKQVRGRPRKGDATVRVFTEDGEELEVTKVDGWRVWVKIL